MIGAMNNDNVNANDNLYIKHVVRSKFQVSSSKFQISSFKTFSMIGAMNNDNVNENDNYFQRLSTFSIIGAMS